MELWGGRGLYPELVAQMSSRGAAGGAGVEPVEGSSAQLQHCVCLIQRRNNTSNVSFVVDTPAVLAFDNISP